MFAALLPHTTTLLIVVSKILINGIGPHEPVLIDLIGDHNARNLFIDIATPPVYLTYNADSLALSMILTKSSSTTPIKQEIS